MNRENPHPNQPIRDNPLLVVKLGSSSVTRSTGPDASILADAIEQASEAMQAGWGVILVTSGAQSLGNAVLKRLRAGVSFGESEPNDYPPKMAAAFGQPILMDFYRAQAEILGVRVSQVLIGASDLRSPHRMQAIATVLHDSMRAGVLPIVNGNDPADDQKTNNDLVAAGIAVMAKASHLLLLTDVPGVFLNADDPEPLAILNVDDIESIRSTGAGTGTGGIGPKLRAAQSTAWNGVITRIASAREHDAIRSMLADQPVGTLIEAPQSAALSPTPSDRRRWIAGGAAPQGQLTINVEAEGSILKGSSLFASGIKRVKGKFEVGDIVEIQTPRGRLIARGQTEVSSTLLKLIRALRIDEIADVLLAILTNGARKDGTPSDYNSRASAAYKEFLSYSHNDRRNVISEVLMLFPTDAANRLTAPERALDLRAHYGELVSSMTVIANDNLATFLRADGKD